MIVSARVLVCCCIAIGTVGHRVQAQPCTPVQVIHPAGDAGDRFGSSVAVSGDTMIVGAPWDDVGATNQGSAHIYRWAGSVWVFEATLTASDGAILDYFGTSVALADDTAIVGAPLSDIGSNIRQGSAYVFVRTGTTWTQQAKLTAADGAANDNFGQSVALAGDTAVVGAHLDDVGAVIDQGSAYVFVRTGTTWTQQAKLTAADGAASDYFGFSLAITGDTAIVGAYQADGTITDQGAAYVFVRSGDSWAQQARLIATGAYLPYASASSVAISGDTAIIGAPRRNLPGSASQGSAYTFARPHGGTTWTQQAELIASDGAASDNFGIAVAISGDAAIIGAYGDEINGTVLQGSAYVFVRTAGGTTWSQRAKLLAPDGASIDDFGRFVAVSGDTAVVGSYLDDVGAAVDQGSAWVFSLSEHISIGPEQAVVAPEGRVNDLFGLAVAIDGATMVIGVSYHDVGGSQDQGAAYVYVRSNGAWTLEQMLTASDGAANDWFGWSVAIDGDTVVVGAPGDDAIAGHHEGSVHTFTRSSGAWTPQQTLRVAAEGDPVALGYSVAIDGRSIVVGASTGSANNCNPPPCDVGVYLFDRLNANASWSLTDHRRFDALDYPNLPLCISDGHVLVSGGYLSVNSAVPVTINRLIAIRLSLPLSDPSQFAGLGSGALHPVPLQPTQFDGNDVIYGGSLSMSGSTAVLAAGHGSSGGADLEGGVEATAFVFERAGTSWAQQTHLHTGIFGAQWRPAVAIDGDTMVIGASVGVDSTHGLVHIYVREGTTWTLQKALEVAGDSAADSASLTAAFSGHTAIIGLPRDNVGTNADQGSARSYEIANECQSVAWNDTLGIEYPSLAEALIPALSFHQITATAAAWGSVTTLDDAGRILVLKSTSRLRTSSASRLMFSGNTSLAAGLGETIEINGEFQMANGSIGNFRSDVRFAAGSQLFAGASSVPDMHGDLDCAINSNARFDLSQALLSMEGSGAEQALEVMSTDIGPDVAGLDRSHPGHYPIGTLRIYGLPTTVRLVDTHDNDNLGQGSCEAIYVDTLQIDAGGHLINPACRIYYNTLINNGVVDVPANLMQITPPCTADFDDDGSLGVPDIFAFLSLWFAGDPSADIDGVPGIGVPDIFAFLSLWFAGC